MFLSSNTDVQKDIYYHHLSTLFVSEETLLNKLIVRFHPVKIFKRVLYALAGILPLNNIEFSLTQSFYLSFVDKFIDMKLPMFFPPNSRRNWRNFDDAEIIYKWERTDSQPSKINGLSPDRYKLFFRHQLTYWQLTSCICNLPVTNWLRLCSCPHQITVGECLHSGLTPVKVSRAGARADNEGRRHGERHGNVINHYECWWPKIHFLRWDQVIK